jgi:hypothetical protein
MAKEGDQTAESVTERLGRSSEAEKQLLLDERKAQKVAAKARASVEELKVELERLQARYDRRVRVLVEAERVLDAARERRAAGPHDPNAVREIIKPPAKDNSPLKSDSSKPPSA